MWKEVASKAAAMLCFTAQDVEMSCATPLTVVTWCCGIISRAGAECAKQNQSYHAEADFSCFVIQYFPLRFRFQTYQNSSNCFLQTFITNW